MTTSRRHTGNPTSALKPEQRDLLPPLAASLAANSRSPTPAGLRTFWGRRPSSLSRGEYLLPFIPPQLGSHHCNAALLHLTKPQRWKVQQTAAHPPLRQAIHSAIAAEQHRRIFRRDPPADRFVNNTALPLQQLAFCPLDARQAHIHLTTSHRHPGSLPSVLKPPHRHFPPSLAASLVSARRGPPPSGLRTSWGRRHTSR